MFYSLINIIKAPLLGRVTYDLGKKIPRYLKITMVINKIYPETLLSFLQLWLYKNKCCINFETLISEGLGIDYNLTVTFWNKAYNEAVMQTKSSRLHIYSKLVSCLAWTPSGLQKWLMRIAFPSTTKITVSWFLLVITCFS